MIIGQITDPHIKADRKLAYGRVDTAAYLEAAIQHMNSLHPKVDVVLLTGDLTDMGRMEEYETLRPLLDQLDMPWYPVPGNHDEQKNFRQIFNDIPVIKNAGAHLCYAVEGYPIRLVGVDSSVPGKPYGSLSDRYLDELDFILAQAPEAPTMLFMHHPPFKAGITHMDVQNLLNAEDFFACLKQHPQVRHIACGHVHRAIETVINGIGVSIAPNSAHSVTLDLEPDGPSSFTMDPPSVRLFQVTDEGMIVSHLSFIGDFDGPHPFFDKDGKLVD